MNTIVEVRLEEQYGRQSVEGICRSDWDERIIGTSFAHSATDAMACVMQHLGQDATVTYLDGDESGRIMVEGAWVELNQDDIGLLAVIDPSEHDVVIYKRSTHRRLVYIIAPRHTIGA